MNFRAWERPVWPRSAVYQLLGGFATPFAASKHSVVPMAPHGAQLASTTTFSASCFLIFWNFESLIEADSIEWATLASLVFSDLPVASVLPGLYSVLHL